MKNIGKFIPVLLILSITLSQLAFAGEARKRISASGDELSDVSDIEAEIVFGRELSARILGNYSLIDDERITRYVNLVGKGLALYAGRPELEFYFGVLDTEEVNAFATPGGYVFITKAALMKMDNEAQLAGVLGHEIAHIVEKHVVKELHIKGDEGSAAGGIAGLIGGTTETIRVALDQALDNATNILFNRGYKVADEIEADRVGILLASLAGYDPLALKEFLGNVRSFEVEDKTYKGEHPVFEIRMREIDKTLDEHGLKNVKKAKVRDRFYENVKK
jgi:predicted Zn-dependent protease